MKKAMPRYQSLYEKIRDDITGGFYPCGTRIPSKRTSAEENGMSLVTVEHAYELLAEEGYIESRQRQGYFVIYQEGELFSGEREVLPKPEAVSGLTEDAFPFSVFSSTARKVLADYGERIMERPEGTGCLQLREALAMYLARSRNMYVSPEQIVIGSGAESMYAAVIRFLGRDQIYGIEDPSYEKILYTYRYEGIQVDQLKMGSCGILSEELRRTEAKVLHVTPYHSYPSGLTADASKKAEYIRWAKKRSGMIIEDDYDSEFTLSTKAEQTLYSMEPDERVIYLNTFTKTIAPSIRVSYMVLPKNKTDEYLEKASHLSSSVPLYSQLILSEIISSGSFERHLNRVRRRRRKEKAVNHR